jgi:hypothetical protein
MTLGRFAVKPGQLRHYHVLYHGKERIPMELVIYWGKGYKEPWYLLVPPGGSLRAEQIVDLYARRMSIEQGFRDWKTHLGIRGMVFLGDNPAPRLTRLLLSFALSYLICLALGSTEVSEEVRTFVEIRRRTSRHGTTRTLSVLYVGILRLSLPRFEREASQELLKILRFLSTGKGLLAYDRSPPEP